MTEHALNFWGNGPELSLFYKNCLLRDVTHIFGGLSITCKSHVMNGHVFVG